MAHIVDKSTTQEEAEADVARFKEHLGPFVVAAETTRMAMVFTDATTDTFPIIFANDSFLELTGYDREEVLGQSFAFLVEDGAASPAGEQVMAQFTRHPSAATEVFYHRKNRTPVWVAIFIAPVFDAEGVLVQHFASFVDLSVHKEGEALSRMLIDELNHRVKNTLATVRSIVSQGLRTSEDVQSVKDTIESRLFALSRSHDLLASENWSGAGLVDLVTEALRPFGLEEGSCERFAVSGANLRLKPNAALALGIAIHELATNAVKYGALSGTDGTVSLAWEIRASSAGDRLHIRWTERGGPPVVKPERKGFGSRVIEHGLAHELGAAALIYFQSEGVVCTIDFPAPDIAPE